MITISLWVAEHKHEMILQQVTEGIQTALQHSAPELLGEVLQEVLPAHAEDARIVAVDSPVQFRIPSRILQKLPQRL